MGDWFVAHRAFSKQCFYAEIRTIVLQIDGAGPLYHQVYRCVS